MINEIEAKGQSAALKILSEFIAKQNKPLEQRDKLALRAFLNEKPETKRPASVWADERSGLRERVLRLFAVLAE